MLVTTLLATTLLTLSASAAPINTILTRRDETFNINVWNNCHWTKQVALYQITGSFQMLQRSDPTNIEPKQMLQIKAPYHDLGMRLSGHAEWGTGRQWNAQALFEFGYSTYAGTEGTAYDLSVMQGSDGDIGIGAYPIRNGRGSGQGWTTPDQTKDGSPADTVCYYGRTDFKVVFCP